MISILEYSKRPYKIGEILTGNFEPEIGDLLTFHHDNFSDLKDKYKVTAISPNGQNMSLQNTKTKSNNHWTERYMARADEHRFMGTISVDIEDTKAGIEFLKSINRWA